MYPWESHSFFVEVVVLIKDSIAQWQSGSQSITTVFFLAVQK
jgi:hypothetical protein